MAGSRPSWRRPSTTGESGWRARPSPRAPGWSSPRAVTARSGPARRLSGRRSRSRSCRWARPTWRRGRWAPGIGGSLATAFGGHERRIDLAVAEAAAAGADGAGITGAGTTGAGITGGAGGLTFAAMAGIGLDAEVVAATPRLLKRRAGWLAYAAAGIMHLPGRGERFTVRLDDDEPLARQARCVVVGNAGLLPGGFTLLPRARLDDGLLDVGILAPSGPAGWLRWRPGADRERPRRPAAGTAPGAPGQIRAETELAREVNGEVITPGRSLTVTLLRRALTVRDPPSGG